jgi:iron only hydrogenase large subunit-like protein
VAIVAPAFLAQYDAPTEQVYGAIKAVGFSEIVEVAQGAMITTEKEAAELAEKIEEGQPFMTTSCCPSYVEMAEKHAPYLKKYISSTRSPMYYTAQIAKEQYPNAKIVFVGPCIAKRKEARRDDLVDYVLTFEELHSIFLGMNIDIAQQQNYTVEQSAIRAAHGFAQGGGVTAAVKEHLGEKFNYSTLQIANMTKKNVALLKAYAKTSKSPAQFIEVMVCEGGCISGPSAHTALDTGKKIFATELAKR